MKAMRKVVKSVSELEKEYRQLFPAEEYVNTTVVPIDPYPAYPSPMRVVQTVTTYSACEEPIPNPYKRS